MVHLLGMVRDRPSNDPTRHGRGPARNAEERRDLGVGQLFRKPLSKDERQELIPVDISGGGYSNPRNTDDMWKIIAWFAVPIVLFFAVIGYIGWRTSVSESVPASNPTPIASSCEGGEYFATIRRSEFAPQSTKLNVFVTFLPGGDVARTPQYELPADPDALITVNAKIAFPPVDAGERCVPRFYER